MTIDMVPQLQHPLRLEAQIERVSTPKTATPPAESKHLFDWKKFIIKVQGQQDYLPVAGRLVWFRQECPDWAITTEIITYDVEKKYAVVRAAILNAAGSIISQATKQENAQGFGDYLEKAETGAVGRALAYAGFGTQFAKELGIDNTGKMDDVVDSPLAPSVPKMNKADQQEHSDILNRIIGFLEETGKEFSEYVLAYMDHREWTGKIQDLSLAQLREYDQWIADQVAGRDAKARASQTPEVAPTAPMSPVDAEEKKKDDAFFKKQIKALNDRLLALAPAEKSSFRAFAVKKFAGVFRPIDMDIFQIDTSNKALDQLVEDPFTDLLAGVTEAKGHSAS